MHCWMRRQVPPLQSTGSEPGVLLFHHFALLVTETGVEPVLQRFKGVRPTIRPFGMIHGCRTVSSPISGSY